MYWLQNPCIIYCFELWSEAQVYISISKRRCQNFQAWMGFEPKFQQYPVQFSAVWAIRPNRSWSCEFVITFEDGNWCTRTLYLKVICIRTVLLSLFTSQQFETEQAPERGSRSCHHWWWSPGNKYRLPSCQTRSKRCCALGKVWTYSWVYMACGKWKEIQIIIINFSLPEISKPWQERL